MAIPTVADRISAGAVAAAVLVLAALSLLLDLAPVYDAWTWLIWGRELGELELDTSAGSSWKPLPVLVTAPLAVLGDDAAPDAWLLVSRAGWIAAAVLAGRLALRLTADTESGGRSAGWLAAAIAALGLVLLFDPFTPWLRQFAGGLSEPLLVALVLGAIDRELAGRRRQALALGVAAALLRPEAWPFLALYIVGLWRRGSIGRGWLVVAVAAVPALWFVPDLAGSGSALSGAERARGDSGAPVGEALEAVARAWRLVPVALWLAAGYAVLDARRSGRPVVGVLAAGALGWIAVVAVMAAGGYAGIPRFAAPAAAVVVVLGAVGSVRAAEAATGIVRAARWRRDLRALSAVAATALLGAALAVESGFRAADLPGDLDGARAYSKGVSVLFAIADEVGPDVVEQCGAPVTTTDFLTRPALAWRLEQPLSDVDVRVRSAPPSGLVLVSIGAPPATQTLIRDDGVLLAERRPWSAYAISCASSGRSAATSLRGERPIAGVAGARR